MIIDAEYKVWLQEINATPAIAKRLLGSISNDIIEVAIDPLFPNQHNAWGNESKYGEGNGFKLVYQSKGKCEFVGNLPAPEAYEDNVEIEQFGGDDSANSKK